MIINFVVLFGLCVLVPGTAAVRRRRQSMKPPVEVCRRTIEPPPIALPAAAAAAKFVDLMHFVQLNQRMFWQFLKCGCCCSK